MNKKTFSLILAIVVLNGFLWGFAMNVNAVDYPEHDPIIIEGNADFTAANGVTNPGAAGTAEDPYIIEELKISTSTSEGGFLGLASAIRISNTTKHFVIRNCRIKPYEISGFSLSSISLNSISNAKFQNIISKGLLSIMLDDVTASNISNCKSQMVQLAASSNNNFSHCDLSNVYLTNSSSHNAFSYCNFENISLFGSTMGCVVDVDETSIENYFHHNNFYIYETLSSAQTANNIWYDESTNEGNWWSDYTGSDSDENGIGDTPYNVPWTGAEDHYPFINKIESAGIAGTVIDADFTYFPYVQVDQQVNFSDASTGDITSWSWNFGDGSYSSKQNPSHTYAEPGNYTVTLTVTGEGGSDSISRSINVTGEQQGENKKPIVTIIDPSSGTSVTKGEKITIEGSATDPEYSVVESVQIQIEGKWRNTTLNTTSWSYEWDTSNVIARDYSIKARAYDLDGNSGTSNTISITVKSGGGSGGTPGFEAIAVFIALLAVVLLFRRRHLIK